MRKIDDKTWWSERLDAWSQEGFNVDSFREEIVADPSSASDLLMKFDSLISKNRSLRKRVISSSMSRQEKRKWLETLNVVENTNQVLEKWNADASINRPWEPYVNKAENRWAERGRRSNLSAIVKRLNNLDPSSYSACQSLLILFDDVSSEHLISSMLEEIENDEARRRKVIHEMIDLLHVEGIDASDAKSMNLNNALEYLSTLQSTADKKRKNRLRIEKEIRPYDDELADRLITKNSDDLNDEVSAIINNLAERLSALTTTIEQWKGQGIKFPKGGKVLPGDLLDWEAGLPEIETAVETHLRALERWKDFATLWPDKCENTSLAGRLDMTEEFVDLVDSLDQEWREFELEGMEIINSWENKGFAMDVWRSRLTEEPRSTITWMKREEGHYQIAEIIIQDLMALDTSIDGEEEVIRRTAILREFDLNLDLLDEMRDYVDTRSRRAARHRSMLESDWMEMVRKGLVSDVATASLSLADFEKLIADSQTNKRGSGIPIGRLEERIEEEINEWYQNGFSVDSMREMLRENPVALGLRLTSIREAVSKHEQLRRRVSSLDWTRDPELSIGVNLDLSMPDRLESLSSRIQDLMMDLAQKKVVDPEFKFIAWRPRTRSRPILMPIPKNSVEDAMEAILEEMEFEIEDDNEEIGEPVGIEVDEEPVPIIEPATSEISELQVKETHDTIIDDVVGDEPITKATKLSEAPGNVDEIIRLESMDEESVSKPKRAASDDDVTINTDADSTSLQNLLRALGLTQNADILEDNGDVNAVRRAIASYVGIEPRDMRVDRLLRLALRLMPKGDSNDGRRYALLSTLGDLALGLSKWTRTRLEARHSGPIGHLLKDAKTLGEALNRIPGPGTPIPLGSDDYTLPTLEDIEGLSNEVNVLKRRVMLASSGGVR